MAKSESESEFLAITICATCGTEYPLSDSTCPFECDAVDLSEPEFEYCPYCEYCGTEHPEDTACPFEDIAAIGMGDLNDIAQSLWSVRLRRVLSPRRWHIRRWLDYPRHRLWLIRYHRAIERTRRHPLDDLPF